MRPQAHVAFSLRAARREEVIRSRVPAFADGHVESPHGPLPKVVLDWADRILNRPPQGPAILADDPLESCPRDLRPAVAPVVGRHQCVELVEVKMTLPPDVAKLERGVVVARILVVDEPNLLAIVDEVLREQIVVARNCPDVAHREGLLDAAKGFGVVEIPRRESEPVSLDCSKVALPTLEHVEGPLECRARMQLATRERYPLDDALVSNGALHR